MRSLAVCVAWLSCLVVACGQDGPVRPDVLPREAAELEIALGRIRLVPDRFRIVRKHEQFDWQTADQKAADEAASNKPATPGTKACSRSLQVSTQDGRPTVKLSYTDPQEKWTLTVDGIVGTEWTRELLTTKQLVKIHYIQRPHQPIQVAIEGLQAKPVKLSAPTLWHLIDQASPEVTQYVLPALGRLNSNWNLPQALAAAKRMRGNVEIGSSAVSQHDLAQCISELDSSDRMTRETAKQKLRSAGLAAHIPLEHLYCGPLTPQQRSTVEELLAELEPRTADTPTRLAYWLAGDPNWR